MHYITNSGQQFATQATAGVVTREVHRLELDRFDQGHCKSIPHGHSGQGRSGRGQIVRADLALNRNIKPDVGMLSQSGLAIASHRNDLVAEGLKAWNQLD
ncbi:hypothetical protein D3C76_1277300 [compost metagenome]